jgi:hypothetical protein
MRISQAGEVVTLINAFDTTPEQQQALIDQLIYFTLVYIRSKSCSHFERSTDFSQAAAMVFRSSLKVPEKRCEKPGKSLHTFQTLSLRLI